MRLLTTLISVVLVCNYVLGQTVITHSASETILGFNSVSCLAGDNTSLNNVYSRSFVMQNFGINEEFKIDSIRFGIEEMNSPMETDYPLYIKFSITDKAYPTGLSYVLSYDTVYIPDTTLALLTFPVSVVVPKSSELVVEIGFERIDSIPTFFSIGTNNYGETAPSYIFAPGCSVNTPYTTSDIGYGDSQLVFSLIGYECSNTFSEISVNACESYISPSGKFVWSESGIYTDIIPNASGCDSVITISLTVNNIDKQIIQVDNYLVSVQADAQYEWIDCGTQQPVPSANKQIFMAKEFGNYALRIQKNGCEFESDCFLIAFMPTGLNIPEKDVQIYPNPTNDIVNVLIPDITGELQYELLDKNATIIEKGVIVSNSLSLSIEQYNSGVYFLRISDSQNSVTYKIVKN